MMNIMCDQQLPHNQCGSNVQGFVGNVITSPNLVTLTLYPLPPPPSSSQVPTLTAVPSSPPEERLSHRLTLTLTPVTAKVQTN